jgi:opacity protein-like surface antigen
MPVLASLLAVSWVAAAGPARAQAPADPAPGVRKPPRFELAVGPGWAASYGLGSRTAQLTGNLGQPSLTLFETESEMAGGIGLDAKLGYRLTPVLRLEAGLAFSRPEFRTSVSRDAEGAAAIVATDRVDQYLVEAALLAHAPRWRAAGGVPYATGGAGYLHQVASEGASVESGAVYHAGAGMAWERVRAKGWAGAWGVRADARVNVRTGGIDIEDAARVWPSAGVRFFVAF